MLKHWMRGFVILLLTTMLHNMLLAADDAPPRLILIGDSTVKNGSGKGDGGLYGWGQVIDQYFDTSEISVENRALGGRSSRTYFTEGLWEKSLGRVRPGDYVLMQFRHNDGGEKFKGNRPRASIKGNGDETVQGTVEMTGNQETVHSYGWYLRKYIADTKAKGATPIVLSLVPRNRWENGKVIRSDQDYAKWAREAAEQAGAKFIDLNDLAARRYEQLGARIVDNDLFTSKDWTHTTLVGAQINAQCVVQGIQQLSDPDLASYLKQEPPQSTSTGGWRFQFDDSPALAGFERVTTGTRYSNDVGYGFEPPAPVEQDHGTDPQELSFSVAVPPGNYRVKLAACNGGSWTVKSELRRLMIQDWQPDAVNNSTCEFTVNLRSPTLQSGKSVVLKPREKESEAAAWDDKLTLELLGENLCLRTLEISPESAATIFLAGDSTVCDQPREPWNSWGQMLTRFFKPGIAVANHSESGESLRSFWGERRFEKIFELARPGDYLFVQFGHNDMKDESPGALDNYRKNLVRAVLRATELGVVPVLVTSMERKPGPGYRSLEQYPQTVRDVAAELEVALIDLNEVSKQLYAALGPDVEHAFQDGTHHTNYGSYLLAQCVVQGIMDNDLPLKHWIVGDFAGFDARHPEKFDEFRVRTSSTADLTAPSGN